MTPEECVTPEERKNHYGSKSRRGTEGEAVFHVIIESAKLARVDPAADPMTATTTAPSPLHALYRGCRWSSSACSRQPACHAIRAELTTSHWPHASRARRPSVRPRGI